VNNEGGMYMAYQVIPKLKEILKERKMTQIQLEKLSGVPQATISGFDRSKQHTDWHIVAISRALNISIEDLFHIIELPSDIEVVNDPERITKIIKNLQE
jgi:transcriptional regulator with XRE-family HTH domain